MLICLFNTRISHQDSGISCHLVKHFGEVFCLFPHFIVLKILVSFNQGLTEVPPAFYCNLASPPYPAPPLHYHHCQQRSQKPPGAGSNGYLVSPLIQTLTGIWPSDHLFPFFNSVPCLWSLAFFCSLSISDIYFFSSSSSACFLYTWDPSLILPPNLPYQKGAYSLPWFYLLWYWRWSYPFSASVPYIQYLL